MNCVDGCVLACVVYFDCAFGMQVNRQTLDCGGVTFASKFVEDKVMHLSKLAAPGVLAK